MQCVDLTKTTNNDTVAVNGRIIVVDLTGDDDDNELQDCNNDDEVQDDGKHRIEEYNFFRDSISSKFYYLKKLEKSIHQDLSKDRIENECDEGEGDEGFAFYNSIGSARTRVLTYLNSIQHDYTYIVQITQSSSSRSREMREVEEMWQKTRTFVENCIFVLDEALQSLEIRGAPRASVSPGVLRFPQAPQVPRASVSPEDMEDMEEVAMRSDTRKKKVPLHRLSTGLSDSYKKHKKNTASRIQPRRRRATPLRFRY